MVESTISYDAAVLIGRLQPIHAGHVTLLAAALRLAPRVFVVLGSAHQRRSPRNPFSWQERAALLAAAAGVDASRVTPLPVRDYYDEQRWRSDIEQQVAAALGPQRDAAVVLVGHRKDATSAYLDGFSGWHYHAVERTVDADATRIRDAYWGEGPVGGATSGEQLERRLAPFADILLPRTLEFLCWFADHERAAYAALCREWCTLRDYRASWATAPYPPVLVTVDALVTALDHVLLVRRAADPGAGSLALPGGFLEQRESLRVSALRELREETGLVIAPTATAQRMEVFDHPDRSARGRVVSAVFHFGLTGAPPTVVGGDDAAEALWVPISQLRDLEAQFFDDHFHVLDVFLGLL